MYIWQEISAPIRIVILYKRKELNYYNPQRAFYEVYKVKDVYNGNIGPKWRHTVTHDYGDSMLTIPEIIKRYTDSEIIKLYTEEELQNQLVLDGI